MIDTRRKIETVRQRCLWSLGLWLAFCATGVGQDTQEPTDVLMAMLAGKDVAAAVQAADKLGERSDEADLVVPALIDALLWQVSPYRKEEPSADSQQVADQAIASLGKIGKPAVLPLRKTLDETENDTLRINVLLALREIPKPGLGTEAALVRAMRHADADTRYHAMETLMTVAERPSKYAIVLTRQLYDSDIENRNRAIEHLVELGPAGYQAIPHLVSMLERDSYIGRGRGSSSTRRRSNYLTICHALSQMGEAAEPAVEALREKLTDPDPRVKTSAALTIARILPDDPQPLKLLTAMASDSRDRESVFWAVRTLRLLGPKAKPAMPVLKELTEHGASSQNQAEAIAAIAAIDPDDALPTLMNLKNDRLYGRLRSEPIRVAVFTALGTYSPEDEKIGEAMIEALKEHPYSILDTTAQNNLLNWGPKAKHLAPQVRNVMHAERDILRRNALAKVLRAMEQPANEPEK